MGKLVVLTFAEGDLDKAGFPVTLQLGDEGKPATIQEIGSLPPNPELVESYTSWKVTYYGFIGVKVRKLEAKVAQTTNFSIRDVNTKAENLSQNFNQWLKSQQFSHVREELVAHLTENDEVRLIIQTSNIQLRQLPWHLWDILKRYPKAEISVSAPIFRQVTSAKVANNQVNILAILGDDEGINVEEDRKILNSIPGAKVEFLVKPNRQALNDQLWEQSWDILFFAGHSCTEGETGIIYINKTESLTIPDLRYALKTAIKKGLQLAIFNSCDGLGLAQDLADLNLPQMIIMREPVPDKVAQEFLKYFLRSFSGGQSFSLAVREARERLQGWESQFPCASWLPVIFQNLAEHPVIWQEFFDPESNEEEERFSEENLSVNLRFIGDRIAGKSTYLASLVRWPNSDPSNSPVQTVIPLNQDAKELLFMGTHILEQGCMLPPTYYDVYEPEWADDYLIQIVIKMQLLEVSIKQKFINNLTTNISVSCKEYMGELFENYLLDPANSPVVEAHVEDCLGGVNGFLVLVDYLNSKDDVYAASLDAFINRLDGQYPIAFVFTKCDRPELWLNRSYPRMLASTRFPKVYQKLEAWQEVGACAVEYFTTSAFGMIGDQFLEPNSEPYGDISSVYTLKNPKYWKPFGLIAPIYWLCTGKRYKELDLA
ncbi:MAG: CHAT domain-containing protein [Tychonema bourrellyi B0820]|nr:CHAT domain-containing protein [Tychonema bourrellyi B0820]